MSELAFTFLPKMDLCERKNCFCIRKESVIRKCISIFVSISKLSQFYSLFLAPLHYTLKYSKFTFEHVNEKNASKFK